MSATNGQRDTGPRRIGRALAAIGALGVLIAAVPVVLVALTQALPLDLGALSPAAWGRADDGRLLLLAIVAMAWIAWAVMVISIGLETWAAVRRVPTPTFPGMALPQHVAAVLVAAVVVALSPAASGPAVGAAAASTVSGASGVAAVAGAASVGADRIAIEDLRERSPVSRQGLASLDQSTSTPTAPTVTTERHDTLWLLAEQYLGAGERYAEIVELNQGVGQPDGRTLGHDGRIYPGWTLSLPADATVDAVRPERHRVVRGDTLWAIAGDELGDPTRYPEIAEANRGDLQPDGRQLTDPDLILTGWVLEIPGVEAPAVQSEPDGSAAAPGRHSTTPDTSATHGASDPLAPIDRATSASASPTAAPAQMAPSAGQTDAAPGLPTLDRGTVARATPGPLSASPLAGSSPATPPASGSEPIDDTASAGGTAISLPTGGAVAALLLAGVGAELVRRRRQFQRHRRPGERMPASGPGAQEVEGAARSAGREPGLDLLDMALIQLAEEADAGGHALPDVRVVRVTAESVVLDLAAPTGDAIAPFIAADDTRWVLSPALLAAELPDRPRALAGLVTLGFVGAETVLLNLESVGTLAVTGSSEAIPDVLRGLAAELAFGPCSAMTERTLCMSDPTIAEAVEAGGIAVERDPARAASALEWSWPRRLVRLSATPRRLPRPPMPSRLPRRWTRSQRTHLVATPC